MIEDEQEKQNEKLRAILRNNFSEADEILVGTETQNIPLVAANVVKSTRSFSVGQIVYIYDGYWGMAEKVKVVGRFRRKHNWIRGVISIKNLGNYRAKVVYEPIVIKKLQGEKIRDNIFSFFLDLPEWKRNQNKCDSENQILSFIRRTINWLKKN